MESARDKQEAFRDAYTAKGEEIGRGWSVEHTFSTIPPPPTVGSPTFRKFDVTLVVEGQHFECEIVLSIDPSYPIPTMEDAEQCVEKRYGNMIRNYVQSGGQTPLPTRVKHVGGWGYQQFKSVASTTPPKSFSQIVEEQVVRLTECISESDAARFYGESKDKTRAPTCETDKPEGTRDVDKFLKEQQNKLWSGN